MIRAVRAAVAALSMATLLALPGAEVTQAASRSQNVNPTVEPLIPGDVPSTPPVVNLTAACIRGTRDGRIEAIFGYVNPGEKSVYAPIEDQLFTEVDRNVILREPLRQRPPSAPRIEKFGPQVTLFRPGRHPYAFAVRYDRTEAVAWRVQIPSSDPLDASWKVTVRPNLVPCGTNVPPHFTVVQRADANEGPGTVVRNAAGNITAYDVALTLANVRVVCSAGGVVQPYDYLAGWSEPAVNVAPLAPVVEPPVPIPEGGGQFTQFLLSPTKFRAVSNIFQEVRWFGPIADVYGFCRFGNTVVQSDVFWAGIPQGGVIEPVIVNGAVVDLDVGLVLPGALRIR